MRNLDELATAAEEAHDWPRAISLLEELAALSCCTESYLRLGRALQQTTNWERSGEAFLSAWRIDEAYSKTAVCFGLLYLERTDMNEAESYALAIQWFEAALSLEETALSYTLLGAAKGAAGNLEGARQCFRQAIERDPTYEEAYFNLAVSIEEDDRSAASELLSKAIELDSEYAAAHEKLGILRHKSGELPDAEYHFRRASELRPADVWPQLYLANVLAVQGDRKGASAHFEAAIALEPDDPIVRGFFDNFRNDEV